MFWVSQVSPSGRRKGAHKKKKKGKKKREQEELVSTWSMTTEKFLKVEMVEGLLKLGSLIFPL